MARWLDEVANCRIHGTTGQRPVDRHAIELPHLRPFAAIPAYDTRPVDIRQVPSDCHIHYQGVRYSVHPDAVGQTVLVRPDGTDVGASFSVYLGQQVVAVHTFVPAGSPSVTLPEHVLAIQNLCRCKARGGAPRKGRQPRFHQQMDTDPSVFPHPLPTPEVQVRSLGAYEALLREVAI